jgi:hypothetical protein
LPIANKGKSQATEPASGMAQQEAGLSVSTDQFTPFHALLAVAEAAADERHDGERPADFPPMELPFE